MDKYQIHWPQVACLGIVVAGTVTALVFVPVTVWTSVPWASVGAGGGAFMAAMVAGFMSPAVRKKEDGES